MVGLSCKKEHNNTGQTPEKGQYKVTFNVGFSQQTGSFQTNGLKTNSAASTPATTALSDQADIIYLIVYDSSGNRIQVIKQLSSDSGFGFLTDSLNRGTYTIVMAAGKTGLILTTGVTYDRYGEITYASSNILSTDMLTYGILGDVNMQDTFYKKFTLTVPGTPSQSISLDRITSRLKIVVEDAIPFNASKLQLSFYAARLFKVGSGQTAVVWNGDLQLASIPLAPSDIGTTNYTYTSAPFFGPPPPPPTIPQFNTVGISFTAPSTASVSSPVIASTTVLNVLYSPNKITVLTGNLFGGANSPATNGFHWSADTSWNSTPTTKLF